MRKKEDQLPRTRKPAEKQVRRAVILLQGKDDRIQTMRKRRVIRRWIRKIEHREGHEKRARRTRKMRRPGEDQVKRIQKMRKMQRPSENLLARLEQIQEAIRTNWSRPSLQPLSQVKEERGRATVPVGNDRIVEKLAEEAREEEDLGKGAAAANTAGPQAAGNAGQTEIGIGSAEAMEGATVVKVRPGGETLIAGDGRGAAEVTRGARPAGQAEAAEPAAATAGAVTSGTTTPGGAEEGRAAAVAAIRDGPSHLAGLRGAGRAVMMGAAREATEAAARRGRGETPTAGVEEGMTDATMTEAVLAG